MRGIPSSGAAQAARRCRDARRDRYPLYTRARMHACLSPRVVRMTPEKGFGIRTFGRVGKEEVRLVVG